MHSNNGLEVPQIGFGTWQAAPGQVERAVTEALRVGYRHIDCALIYGNQSEVQVGIAESGVPREEIVLVSKLWNNSHRPERVEADLDLTLKQLGTKYLDVYLIHWPVPFAPGDVLAPREDDGKSTKIDWEAPGVAATWKEMVRIYKETGKVKAIGVSNFNVELLEKIVKETGVVPVMNQIEAHPSLIQPELFAYCRWCFDCADRRQREGYQNHGLLSSRQQHHWQTSCHRFRPSQRHRQEVVQGTGAGANCMGCKEWLLCHPQERDTFEDQGESWLCGLTL